MNLSIIKTTVLFFLAAMTGVWAQSSQTTSATDGKTPLALQPGEPMGAYILSGFDNINLFNGALSFRLPLLNVRGRGEAAFDMTLWIQRQWRVQHTRVPSNCGQFGCTWNDYYYPVQDHWAYTAGYGPGILIGRWGGDGDGGCPTAASYYRTLTRLTFIASDGTEYELRDELTRGQALQASNPCGTGENRGAVFTTADGCIGGCKKDAFVSMPWKGRERLWKERRPTLQMGIISVWILSRVREFL